MPVSIKEEQNIGRLVSMTEMLQKAKEVNSCWSVQHQQLRMDTKRINGSSEANSLSILGVSEGAGNHGWTKKLFQLW